MPRFGGRAWTTFSAGLLLIPALLVAIVVPSGWLADQSHDTQFWVLLGCAATAGVGGGNFSSSMANISFFYPEGRKGFALGLNAAGGNLGVAATQLLVPLVIIVGVPVAAVKLPVHEVHLAYAGLMWMPFIVAASLGAWLYMDSLSQAKSDRRSYAEALKQPQTWVMSVLYIGTFGSFIGFSFTLPLVIRNTFPEFLAQHTFIATYLAGLGFVGALIGSVARPLGGWLADRVGGARVTVGRVRRDGAGDDRGDRRRRQPQLPAVLRRLHGRVPAVRDGQRLDLPHDPVDLRRARPAPRRRAMPRRVEFKRQAAAVIGIAGAIGAFGGFLIQVVLRQATLSVAAAVKAAETPAEKLAVAQANADWSIPALWVFVGAYVVFGVVTWFVYLRRSFAVGRVPSLAHEAI